MAPTKRKNPGSSKSQSCDEPASDSFCSNEARSSYRGIIRRTVIQERGINCTPPFEAYIDKHGWEAFCQNPVNANMTLANEFYANFRHRDEGGYVMCRGKRVQLSPESINGYYRLRSTKSLFKEFNKLLNEATIDDGKLVGDWNSLVRAVTLESYGLEVILPKERWGSIDKKYLTTEMNVWYTFIAARLSPVTINSEVQWERLRLLYAIKQNFAIPVGVIIFSAMVSMSNSAGCIGFHSLITGLCHRAGCEDRLDDAWKQPKGMLTFDAFHRRVGVHVRPLKPPTPSISGGVTLESIGATMIKHGQRLGKIEDYMMRISEQTAALVAQHRSWDSAKSNRSTSQTSASHAGGTHEIEPAAGGYANTISTAQNVDGTGMEDTPGKEIDADAEQLKIATAVAGADVLDGVTSVVGSGRLEIATAAAGGDLLEGTTSLNNGEHLVCAAALADDDCLNGATQLKTGDNLKEVVNSVQETDLVLK